MKIAIIVQRYGLQINGGAELHARQLAEKLYPRHQVSVFTTKAESYIVWDNNIDKDFENINGIDVYRFKSGKKDKKKSHKYYRRLRNLSKIPIFLRKKGFLKLSNSNLFSIKRSFRKWLRYQGPYCPELPEKIASVKDDFDVFIFFTYLYYPTNVALPLVADKSLLIPTAHDEKPFYFTDYKHLFEKVKFIMYNSNSEKELVENTFIASREVKNDIAGVGVDIPDFTIENKPLDVPYFVYIGRIDTAKNVHELVEWFNEYVSGGKEVKLVLVGKNDGSDIKGNENIIFTGFVSEQEKNNWLYHSKALIIPSKFESLSMVTLEAMNMGKPVIANNDCDVLSNHIKMSKAGYAYRSYAHFEEILDKILASSQEKLDAIGENGKKYVKEHYRWGEIIKKFDKAFAYIKEQN